MAQEKVNVLYISYDGMTDPLGQSQVLPYLKGLTTKGYQYTLISFEKKGRFEKNRALISALCNESNIEWIPLTYTKSPPVLSTIKDVLLLRKTAFQLHKKNQYAIVHCRSYLSSIIGLALKNKFGLKFIFDMRGFWADERIDGGLWNLKNPIYKVIYNYFKKKEKTFIQNADAIISLTHNGKKEMNTWGYKKTNKLPITVIPCCVDLNHFDSKKVNNNFVIRLRKDLNISENDFVLTYLGSIGTWYMLKEMLEFFKLLLKYEPSAKFLFITGEPRNYIEKEALKMNIPIEKIRIRYGQREEVPMLLALGNFSIFFIKPVFSKKSSSPTKQGEIMAMGIPAICNSGVGDTDDIIETYQSGYLLKDFSTLGMERIIQLLIKGEEFDKKKIRDGAIDYFSLNKGIVSYNKIYEKLLTN